MQDWLTLRWTTLLVRGLVGIAFGVLAMSWPDETISLLVLLWGCWALVDGLVAVVFVGKVPGTGAKVVAVLIAVVSLVVAFFAILKPGVAAATLTWFLGAWLLVRGVLEIVQAFQAHDAPGRWTLAAVGVLDIVIGGLFMANPGTAALGIAFLLGLLAAVWGVALVVLAFFVRRNAPRTQDTRSGSASARL